MSVTSQELRSEITPAGQLRLSLAEREVAPPGRLVYTLEFEGMPGHVALEILVFDEQDGKTMLTDTMRFDTTEDRDGMLQSGMEQGAAESCDRLAELP